MATAGSIVVDLLMRTGSFETDAQRASKTAEKRFREIERSARETGASVAASVGRMFAGPLAAIGATVGVAQVFGKFITETRNAQDEQAQLAAALKSTGEAAGFTIGQLNNMATQFASVSTFSEGDINKAQTRLLSYTGIVGEQFPRAMQAVIDTSARMGMSVEQAAETVGRALDVPSQGLSSLSRQGFRFTEEQKKLVESLEATGRVGEAQAIVLSALESSYGGAAAAARNTLGGALTALQNQVDSLMTGDDGSVSGLTSQINQLTNVLGSPEARQAFADFVGWLADVSKALANAAVDFAEGLRAAGGFMNGLTTYAFMNPFNTHSENAEKYRKELEDLEVFQRKVLAGEENAAGIDLDAKRQQLLNRIAFSERNANRQVDDVFAQYSGVGETGGSPDLKPKAKEKKPDSVPKGGKEQIDQGQRLIDQMNERIALIGKETEYEQLLAKVSLGSIKFRTQAQQDQALAQAQTIDFMAEQQRAYEETQDMLKTLSKVNQDTLDQTNEFTIQAARNIESYLGDGLYDVLSGNFDDIGKSFASMVARMAAEAAAANLSQALLGEYGKTKQIGGLFGSMAAMFAGSAITAASGVTIGGAPNAVGSTAGMSYLPPFAAGGYTGPGGKFDVAGVVHAGEYVFDAESTRRLGVGNLEALRGYADSGYVGKAPPVSFNGNRTGDIAVTVNVSGQGSSVSTTGDQQNQFGQDLAEAVKATVRAEIARSYRPGGVAYNKSIGR